MMDMESLETKVSEPFIKEFEDKEVTPKDSFQEILTHELTHFMKFPGSVVNIFRLQKAGQGIADPAKISELRTEFTEAQTNIYLTKELKMPNTARMRRLLPKDGMSKLMYGVYQEISMQDFGVELEKPEKDLADKLKQIDFTNKSQELYNFRRFAEILKDYNPPQDKKNKSGNGKDGGEGGEGDGKGNSSNGNSNGKKPSKSDLKRFTKNQIRDGLKQFAEECRSPKEYEDIVKQVMSEIGEGEDKKPMGLAGGLGRDITLITDNFYSALAEKYCIPIKKKPMEKNGSLYPHSHTPFEVSDSITEVDPFSTPGILPGITKKWIRREGEGFADEENVPNSLIIIDNSPSMFMPDGSTVTPPNKRVYPHIVGATAISNAYLINGSRVAVYSFGSDDHLTYPTKETQKIHRELRRYSSNGGTIFNSSELEKVLKQSEKAFDVSIISDMGIANLNSFVEAVLKIPQTHRIHLLYTECSSALKMLQQTFGEKENVAILPLAVENDIYKITMGELKKSVK